MLLHLITEAGEVESRERDKKCSERRGEEKAQEPTTKTKKLVGRK